MKRALVTGINNYPSAPLRGCVNDAQEFAALLERNDDHSLNFNVLLRTDIPRKHELMGLIADLFTARCDTALFYFSGHGFTNELGGYLVTPDQRPYDEGVSMNDLLVLANSSPATNRIIILDCCYSGAAAAPMLTHSSIGHISEGVTLLTASRHDEPAVEVRGRGIFTDLLLEAMKGGAADLNGNITPNSVYAYIDQALGAWGQRPVFKANVSRFVPLRRTEPQLPVSLLRKITDYFPDASAVHALDPSYEPANDPAAEHHYVLPYAQPGHVAVLRELQQMQRAGLVAPVAEEHMYFAAMKGSGCRLTPLGRYYWRLVATKKI